MAFTFLQMTLRDIPKGEQITVDYGGGYWATKAYKPLNLA